MGSHLTQNTTFPPYMAKPELGTGAACSFNWKGRHEEVVVTANTHWFSWIRVSLGCSLVSFT